MIEKGSLVDKPNKPKLPCSVSIRISCIFLTRFFSFPPIIHCNDTTNWKEIQTNFMLKDTRIAQVYATQLSGYKERIIQDAADRSRLDLYRGRMVCKWVLPRSVTYTYTAT